MKPTELQVICDAPCRYGGLDGEWGEGFVYVRFFAFSSSAAFGPPAEMISAGGLVKKILIPKIFVTFR